jgi:hypothetical protein
MGSRTVADDAQKLVERVDLRLRIAEPRDEDQHESD